MATMLRTTNRGVKLDLPGSYRLVPALHHRVIIQWNAVVDFLVPVGYEDAQGFHYGRPVEEVELEAELPCC
jgi:hypothetical protein